MNPTIEFECPKCKSVKYITASTSYQSVTCDQCKETFSAPPMSQSAMNYWAKNEKNDPNKVSFEEFKRRMIAQDPAYRNHPETKLRYLYGQGHALALKTANASKVILTTETFSPFPVDEHLGIITAECALGMNIFKDIFAGVRDIVGGQSKTTQNTLRDAKDKVLQQLREEAAKLGADAVVAVNINYSEFSGGGKSMLFVVAVGTAIKISQ